jgi:hypothetical protein
VRPGIIPPTMLKRLTTPYLPLLPTALIFVGIWLTMKK